MDEQLLKDFIATAESLNYDWNTVFGKFPELQGYDQQLLKDYVATAQANGYDYAVVNPKFPEFGFGGVIEQVQQMGSNLQAAAAQPQQRPTEAPRMPKPGEMDNIGKEDDNAFLNSQGEYNVLNSLPSAVRGTAKQIQAENEVKKKAAASGTTALPSEGSSLASQSPQAPSRSDLFNIDASQKPETTQVALPKISDLGISKEFVARANMKGAPSITNEDGSKSTHKMASAEVDGKFIAYPTIIRNQYNKLDYKAQPNQTPTQRITAGLESYMPGAEKKPKRPELVELSPDEALAYALKNNEYLTFPTEEAAQAYAKGEYKRGTPLEAGARPEWFDKSLNTVDAKLINQTEEYVIPQMNYQFGPLGFEFKISGWSGDYMLATAPNGEEREFSLDPTLQSSAQNTATELKEWIKLNTPISGLDKLNSEYEKENKRYANQKEVENEFKKIDEQATAFKNDVNAFLAEKNTIDQELNALSSAKATAPLLPEAQARYDFLLNRKEQLKTTYKLLTDKENEILSSATILDKAVGRYQMMQAEQGDYAAGSWNAALEGEGGITAGVLSLTFDVMFSKYFMGVDEDQLTREGIDDGVATGDIMQDAKNGGVAVNNARRLNEQIGAPTDQKELDAMMSMFRREGGEIIAVNAGPGMQTMTPEEMKAFNVFQKYIPMPKAGQSYRDWYNSLTDDQRTALVDKSNDDIKKDLKKNILPAAREGLRTVLGDDAATVAWSRTKEETFWGGALLGVAKSLPSVIGGSGPAGWAQRTAQAYAQGSDAVYEEMSKNPAFDNISESEKLSVVAPIGIAVGVLESVGFSNLINNKGLVNKLVVRAMGKTVGSVGAKTFGQIVKDDVTSMGAKGLLTLAGAGLAEAETGTLQQVAEYGIKDIYNMAKEKDMFQTPEFLSADYFKDVATAGAQEMIGGFIMGVPGAIGAAYTKTGYKSLSDQEFKAFESIANDDNIQTAYILGLKNKVATGQMKPKAAKEALNNYRNSVGLYRKMPDGLSTEAKKEAMNLLKEKRDLEQYTRDKDAALVKKQKSRIEAINGELDQLANKPVVETETVVNLTEQEQNRKTELETAIAKESGKGTVTIGDALIPIDEAQAELDALNEKETAEVIEEITPTEQQVPTILATAEATTAALELLPEGERTNITFTQEDGTETPVMGNEKMLAELFQQAQAVPEADRTDFHQNIIDAVNVALSDQIEEEQMQMQEQEDNPFGNIAEDNEQIVFEADNLEDIPEQFRGGAVESGPQEITARKKILGLPVGKKEVVKRKGRTFKFVVTGAEAKANANSLLPLFDNGKIRYEGTLARKARATDKANLFKNVSKSLASILPNLGIRNFKTSQELKSYVDSKYKGSAVSKQVLGSEGGMIIYDKDGKPAEILINETTSGATTLPHEVWHAILVKAFGENEALFKEFRDSILKTLTDNGYQDIVDTLNTFSSTPEYKASNKQAQEWLVEFGGLLTASGITPKNLNPQSRTLLEQIKAVFNKIAMEMLGEPLFLEDATAEDVLDFMVSISDAMSRGEDISTFFSPKGKTTATGKASTVSKQMGQTNPAEEVRRIAQRYNVNNSGFAPNQINEFALDKELRPYGYSAKRAAPDANGKQRGVYILNPKGRFHNPFKGKFQKVSKKATEPKKTKMSREKQVYNAKVLANKLARLTGIPVKYIDDPKQMFKGKIEDRVAIVNLAYVTADTPIHEILGHPVIASLKETDREFYDKLVAEVKNSKQGASILARIKEDYSEYTEEQQIEEAIVEMLSLMTSNRLENNSELKKLLTKILNEIIKLVNKGFNTNFGKDDAINLTALSKDIEDYVNQVESNLNRDIKALLDLFIKDNTSTYLSVQPNEITLNGRKILQNKYSDLSKFIAAHISDAPMYANKFIKFVDSLLLDPRQGKAFLSEEKNLSYVNALFGKLTGRRTSKEGGPIEDPFKLLSQEGYDLIPIKDFQHLWSFTADYDKGYVICTFKSKEEAQGRLDSSFVFWIRKSYASDILPYDMLTQEYLQSSSQDAAEWRQYLYNEGYENEDGTFRIPSKPSIYDPYAISSISLQIKKDPSSTFQKMVNRYNHEIDISKGGDGVADAAFSNDLNNIVDGLDNSIRDYVDLPQKESKPGYNTINVGGKFFVYNSQLNIDTYNRVYISKNGYVEGFYDEATGELSNEKYHEINPDIEILSPSGYLFNKKDKTIKSLGKDSFFDDAVDIEFIVDSANRNVVVVTHKNKSVTEVTLNDANDIIYISSDVKTIGDDFMSLSKRLKFVDLPLVEKIGDSFLLSDNSIQSINLPNVKKIGKMFMVNNNFLQTINLPSVETIDVDFLKLNNEILYLELPKLKKIVGNFMTSNSSLIALVVPELKTPGWGFLTNNNSLRFLELPNAATLQNGFLPNNDNIEYAFLGYRPYVTDKNVNDNNIYNSLKSFSNKNYSDAFSKLNKKAGFKLMYEIVDNYFVRNNKTVQEFIDDAQEKQGITVSAQRGGVLQESVEKIPGYDLMISNAKKVALRTSRRYAADYNRIMNAVMEYVKGSKVYELADDSQREQLVRNVRAEYGKKEKSAPSPTKVFELPTVADLFGAIEDVKMITMTELQLLNKQMKDLARGAKDAKMSWMAVSKQVAKQIKELVIAGKISNRQAASVISRLAMVNMFNQDSIDKFTDYMAKVFNDANYDMKIEKARKKLPRALSNLKKKIGIANAVAPNLVKLFSINPNLIPDSVLETYLELVEMFGSSDSVLNLGDIDLVAEDTKAILDAVDSEVSSAEELALRFEEFDDKVYDEDGKLDYAKTVAKMLDKEAIDDAEAEIMRKYKKIIFPKVAPEKKTDAEIEEEKKALIKAIKSVTVDVARLPTRLERDLAKRLVALLKPELLKKLSVNQLENVSKLIDNINAGYLPRYAMITVEKLNSVQMAANDLETAIADGKALKVSGFIGKIKAAITGKTAELEMIRRSPLVFIDQIFGDFKTKRIFNAVFGMLARGQAAFDTDINKVNQRLDDARNAVSKSLGYDANATLESSYRMMAYMIQLEYESNLGSDQVNPASSFIKATVKRMLNDKTNKFKERDAVLLENILKEYGVDVGVDAKGKPIREIDNKKLFKSFNVAERNALKTIREINDGLTEKAQYTASIIRGESITPLNNYVHLPVLHDYDPNERSTGIQNSTAYNNSRRPSTKAKTLEGRTGDVSPINFDAFASAQKGAKATLLDFHLTEAIRTSRKTINETRALMEEKGTLRGSKRDLLNAIESANEEVIRNVLTNNFVTDSFGDAVINEVSKQGYRAILASSKRFVAELSSNVGFVLFTDPKAFAQGLSKKTRSIIMSPSAINVMDNVGSKQTSRLFSGDSLSGKFIDTSILGEASGVRTNKVQGTVKNVSNIIYNKSLKKVKNRVELIADTLISTPDKLVMRPVWFGAFANEFKKQTGSEVDFDKIAANDEAYMSKYGEAISKSRDAADEKSTLTGASDNPFMGILKGAVTADQSGWTRAYNNFNNFMTRFAIYEFAAARQGIYAAMGDGTLTRKEGAALLAGVVTRMTMYTLLTNVLGSLLLSAFGDEEEKETEKSFMQKFEQALASTATSLLVGRDFGNTVKLFTNVGVEKINEKYFDFLRNGDYDPYEDYISYSAIPKDRKGHQTDLGDYALMFTGSFTPLVKTIDLGIRKMREDPKKEPAAIERQKAEIYKRLPIEMLGHMGLIPMYNEVRAVLMSQIYSSLEQEMKAEKVSEKERAIEKEKLGKYETRTDMKRYDPELYEKTFGPGSPGYDAEKAKKKLAEEKGDAKRAEKDKYFGYQESYTDRVDREDRERIEKIKESPNYDPNAVPTKDLLTRSELKEYFPEDYEKKYGEDSEYYKEKEPETKEQKLARAKRKAMLDAAYGRPKSKKGEGRLGGDRLGGSRLGGDRLGGSRLGGGRLGGGRLGGSRL